MSTSTGPPSPTVEFLIPYAGPRPFLVEAVQSIVAQSDPHWVLTVVEDGDQDRSVQPWIRDLTDPRIRYASNVTTLGIAGNFQRCLDLATADYVCFPGCDDRLRTNYVATMRAAITEHSAVALIQPGVGLIDTEGRVATPLGDRVKKLITPRGPRVMSGDALLSSLMHGNWAYFPSLCWRRDLIATHGFRQDLATVLDLELIGRVVLEGGSMLVTPEVTFDYRRHRASASSLAAVRSDRFDEETQVMSEIAQVARSRGWDRTARAARVRITSRVHALLQQRNAVAQRDWQASKALWAHATRWH